MGQVLPALAGHAQSCRTTPGVVFVCSFEQTGACRQWLNSSRPEKGRTIRMTTPSAYSVAIPRDGESSACSRKSYRTMRSFVAVHFDLAGKGEIVFLPEGAILRIVGPSSCLREGFEVMFEERVYNIFKIDLLARCRQMIEPTRTEDRAVVACA